MNIPKLYFAFLLLPMTAMEQVNRNYSAIGSSDTEAEIIRKAAQVVPSPRQLRWQQLEVTAFFHFGINTFTNHEWGDGKEDISQFNPEKLDARQWVRIAKESGIKQVIITAKHHDGFCLWPSQYTEHSVKNTPWKNGKGDVVKEVSEACREYGIGFGVYLSPWDRNSAIYGDSEKYNAYFENQLTELLTHYGRVDEVWFDGANGEGPNGKKPVYDFPAWYALIRKLQPTATIAIMGPDVRWVGTESGVGRLTEWSVLPVDAQLQEKIAAGSQTDVTFAPQGNMMTDDLGSRVKIVNGAKGLIWYPAETDVSIRPGWFHHPEEDEKVKTAAELFSIYLSSLGRNSLLLLNIPPDKHGLIGQQDELHLKAWKKRIDGSFTVNQAKGAVIHSANGLNTAFLLDGKAHTHFTTSGKDTSSVIEFGLKGKKTFDLLVLQEDITVGQRIEGFVLEYRELGDAGDKTGADKAGAGWKKIAEGTTVGYKRILQFPAVTADKVRLRIVSSRMNPTIAEFGLYKEAK